jgi:hypothetical protein
MLAGWRGNAAKISEGLKLFGVKSLALPFIDINMLGGAEA